MILHASACLYVRSSWFANFATMEVLAMILALVVKRSSGNQRDYDSDDEYIAPRSSMREPLLNRQGTQTAEVPAPVSRRAARNDAWSARMREKYGLDTTEFTYNPTESNRYVQPTPQPTEDKSRCTIM